MSAVSTRRRLAFAIALALSVEACSDAEAPTVSTEETAGGDDSGALGDTLITDLGGPTLLLAAAPDGTRVAVVKAGAFGPYGLPSGEIHVVELASGIDWTIHTSLSLSFIASIEWVENDVVFLEQQATTGVSALFIVDSDGRSAAAPVGSGEFGGASALFHEDGGVFVLASADTYPVGPTVDRVDLTSEEVERVGKAVGTNLVPIHLLADDGIYFVGSQQNHETGNGERWDSLYHLATSDRDAPARLVMQLGPSGTGSCSFPHGGLVSTGDRLVCGADSVQIIHPTSGSWGDLIVENEYPFRGNMVWGATGDEVYLFERSDGIEDVHIEKVAVAGGDVVPLASDVRMVASQGDALGYAHQFPYQIDLAGDRIVWIEQRLAAEGDEARWLLRAVAR